MYTAALRWASQETKPMIRPARGSTVVCFFAATGSQHLSRLMQVAYSMHPSTILLSYQ